MVLRVSVILRLRAVDEVHEFGRFGGDGAHALDQVQRDAFGEQHRAGAAGDARKVRAGVERFTVGEQQLHLGVRVNQLHGIAEHGSAAEHARDPGVEHRGGAGLGRDQQLGGDVAAGRVLGKGPFQDVPDGCCGEGQAGHWTRLAFRLMV